MKENPLPELTEGQEITAKAAMTEHDTTPPKAYTEDTLLSAMERAGSGDISEDAERKAGIDKESFGFNAALHEDGKLTDYGYIARSGTDWKEVYAGQETPERYRIMSYPEAGRTAPAQEEKEADPKEGAAPQDIAAANPSRPIELTAQRRYRSLQNAQRKS